ncbi:unnamed protein product, partial [Phaeothamnion confervicola]
MQYTTKTSVQSFAMVLVVQVDEAVNRLTILQVSENFAEHGYRPHEMIGRDAREILVGPADVKALRRSVLLCRKNRRSDHPMNEKQIWETFVALEMFDGTLQVADDNPEGRKGGAETNGNGGSGGGGATANSATANGNGAAEHGTDAKNAFSDYIDQLYSKWKHAAINLAYG